MEKILLAVGFRQLEEYLEQNLKNEYEFVGTTVYREGILKSIEQKNPDIVVIRETLEGTENIMKIVHRIRDEHPNVRILFIAGKREVSDELLVTLVNFGVYDILQGDKVKAQRIVGLIRTPNEYKDVKHYQPIPIFDEQRNKMVYAAQEVKEVIKEVEHDSGFKGISPLEKNPFETGGDEDEDEIEYETEVSEEKEKKFKIQIPVPKLPSISEIIPEIEIKQKKEEPKERSPRKEKTEKPQRRERFSERFSPEVIKSQSGQGIITFLGAKGGSGTTSLALNTATLLAGEGCKVIFLELNELAPSVNYIFDLNNPNEGLDTALKYVENEEYGKIKNTIVRAEDLKNGDNNLQSSYKKLPKTLDFCLMSDEQIFNKRDILESKYPFKELYLYFLFQAGYDYVIIDAPYNYRNKAVVDAVAYSSKVFIVTTQDVSTIGYSILNNNELKKLGISLEDKSYFIINKFNKSSLSIKEIKNWINTDKMLTVLEESKDFNQANLVGLPVCISSKNANLRNDFKHILQIIRN